MPIRQVTDSEYHEGEGISKSGLWDLWTKTPFHYRYGVKPERAALELGKASHIAILEPARLEEAVIKGPADRRGNKWKEAQDFARFSNAILLTESDYETVLRIRDLSAAVPALNQMRDGEHIVETAAYHVDEETGMLLKTKPDMFSVDQRMICDIKNVVDASPSAFARSVAKFGYHVQEPVYTDVWSKGSGYDVEAFFFVVFEKSDPPMVAVYELDASAVAEGHAIYRAALAKYAECVKADNWPGYSAEVQTLHLKPWDYKLTRPEAEDMEGGE